MPSSLISASDGVKFPAIIPRAGIQRPCRDAPLSFGGYIIDTPGIKEFGLVDFDRREVWERFPEMRALMHLCRFTNCTHVHEPGCAVRDALDEGRLPLERYINYLSILNDDYWEETESDYDK
jgi:ribosome biogenesis GTPase